MDPAIVAAIITVVGGVLITLISTFLSRTPTPQPTPVTPVVVVVTNTDAPTAVPTDTVPPGDPTSTPAPATDTPAPTLTFTVVPPVAIGEDWRGGCISSLWRPHPSSIPTIDQGNGCWQEPVHVFSAVNGSLTFLDARNDSEVYGLFAPLPESGSVTFTVRLKDLSKVDLWMGVYTEPDITSNGLLLTIPEGNVRKRVIVQKDATTYETLQTTANLDQGDGFSITLTFNALSANGTVNPNVFVTNPVSLPSAHKWLFLGYKGLSGSYRIEGEFSDLVIK